MPAACGAAQSELSESLPSSFSTHSTSLQTDSICVTTEAQNSVTDKYPTLYLHEHATLYWLLTKEVQDAEN